MCVKSTNYCSELSASIQAPSLVLMHHKSSRLRMDASAKPLLCLSVERDLSAVFLLFSLSLNVLLCSIGVQDKE